MKFWTIQGNEVKTIIEKDGIYFPDFESSRYAEEDYEVKPLYDFVLNAFNEINHVCLTGLVYAFAVSDNEHISEISTINAFRSLLQSKKNVMGLLYDYLIGIDGYIFELDYSVDFNPLFIDLNDFQFIMPKISVSYPYTMESICHILGTLKYGKCTKSVLPSGIIQAHLPYIKVENIVNTYDIKSIL